MSVKFFEVSTPNDFSAKQKVIYSEIYLKLDNDMTVLKVSNAWGSSGRTVDVTDFVNDSHNILGLNQNGIAVCRKTGDTYEVLAFYDTSDGSVKNENPSYDYSRHNFGFDDGLGSSKWFVLDSIGNLIRKDDQLSFTGSSANRIAAHKYFGL